MDRFKVVVVIGGVQFSSPVMGPTEAHTVADAVLLTAPKLNPIIVKVEA